MDGGSFRVSRLGCKGLVVSGQQGGCSEFFEELAILVEHGDVTRQGLHFPHCVDQRVFHVFAYCASSFRREKTLDTGRSQAMHLMPGSSADALVRPV